MCMYELFLAGLNKLTGQDEIDDLTRQLTALSFFKNVMDSGQYQSQFNELSAKLFRLNKRQSCFIRSAQFATLIAGLSAAVYCVNKSFADHSNSDHRACARPR